MGNGLILIGAGTDSTISLNWSHKFLSLIKVLMNPFTNLSTFASATSPNVITLSSKSITTSSCAPCWISLCWISLCWFSLCWFSELRLIVTSGSSLSYVSLSKSARSMDWDLSGVLFLGLWTALSGVLFLGLWTALAGVLVLELWDDDAGVLAIELWAMMREY